MENFNFSLPTQIYFGRNRHTEAGTYISGGERVLVLYGSDRTVESGLLSEIRSSLEKAGIWYVCAGGVRPNPRLSKVYDIIRLCRRERITWILALGGGSVIDTAKAAALGIEDERLWDYFTGERSCGLQVRTKLGVILTIAASGSETSSTAVITNDLTEPWEKRDFSYRQLKPAFAILNPELTFSLSWENTACGGIDIFSHILERYFTRAEHNELTDGLCEAAMRTVIRQLEILKEDPVSYDARAELMWAGTVAHSNFLSAGRRSDWATHAMEHEISALYDIRHGTGLSILFPAWMGYVYRQDVRRFKQYAECVWDVKEKDDEKAALLGIQKTKEFFHGLGQPVCFSQLGIFDMDIELAANQVAGDGCIGDFVRLSSADIGEILRLAQS